LLTYSPFLGQNIFLSILFSNARIVWKR